MTTRLDKESKLYEFIARKFTIYEFDRWMDMNEDTMTDIFDQARDEYECESDYMEDIEELVRDKLISPEKYLFLLERYNRTQTYDKPDGTEYADFLKLQKIFLNDASESFLGQLYMLLDMIDNMSMMDMETPGSLWDIDGIILTDNASIVMFHYQ